MNRQEFMKDLRRELGRIPFEEREAAIRYYEEYFDEAGPDAEPEVIARLGTPKQVAQQIMSDYMIKDLQKPVKTTRQGVSKIWMIVLAIFASPIAIPLAIAVAAVVFAVVVAVLAVVFAFGVSALAMVAGGILYVVIGVSLIFSGFATVLYFVGAGAAAIGLGVLTGYFTLFLGVKATAAIAWGLGRFFNRKKEAAVQ